MPEEKRNYKIKFKNLNRYRSGEYESFLWFFANGNPYGNKITLKIIIKEQNIQKNEIEQYMDKIKEFRENFALSEEDYSDEKLTEVLKKTNCSYEKAFDLLFD